MTSNRNRNRGRSAPKKKAPVGQKKGAIITAVATENVDGDESKAQVEAQEDVNIDEHPFTVGHSLIVNYRDGSKRLAKIIERHHNKTKEKQGLDLKEQWKYYVHYEDFNRRMDEWVENDRIAGLPSEANPKADAIKEAADEAAKKLADEKAALEAEQQAGGKGGKSIGQGLGHGAGFGRPGAANLHFVRKKSQFELENEKKIQEELGDTENAVTTIADDEHDEHEGLDEKQLKEHEEVTKIKNISNVRFGKYYMECWYFSPFPKELFADNPFIECLYFCEFSFRFFRSKDELVRYQSKPGLPRHPPGTEIYRDDYVSMFELDGAMEKIYW